jgi:hypothetical protein
MLLVAPLDRPDTITVAQSFVDICGPILALCGALELLIDRIRRPPFWDRREDLYLLLDGYVGAELLDRERLGHSSVQCCQFVQNNTADYTECHYGCNGGAVRNCWNGRI